MTNISVVVILYNSKLIESETLQSILCADLPHNIMLTINIWNNGPMELAENDISLFLDESEKRKITINIRQDLRNIALSKVYNYFLSQGGYDLISIFDQDTNIEQSFFTNLLNYKHLDLILPLVYSNKDKSVILPRYADQSNITGDKVLNEHGEVDLTKIFTINSGLTFTQSGRLTLENIKSPIFNENYAFYGIDTELFFRIREYCSNTQNKRKINSGCYGKITHSLSSLEEEVYAVKQKRKLEERYAVILEQIYLYKKSRWCLFKKIIKQTLKHKMTLIECYQMLWCIVFRKHPRSKFTIQ